MLGRPRSPGLLLAAAGLAVFLAAVGSAQFAGADQRNGRFASALLLVGAAYLLASVLMRWQQRRLPGAAPQPVDGSLDGDMARVHPRWGGYGLVVLFGTSAVGILMGAWTAFLLAGSRPGWALVTGAIGLYALGLPILWLAGLWRPGGLWMTDTRLVDVHYGLRTMVAYREVTQVVERADVVHVITASPVEVQRLAPGYGKRASPRGLVIDASELSVGAAELAAELRRRAGVAG